MSKTRFLAQTTTFLAFVFLAVFPSIAIDRGEETARESPTLSKKHELPAVAPIAPEGLWTASVEPASISPTGASVSLVPTITKRPLSFGVGNYIEVNK